MKLQNPWSLLALLVGLLLGGYSATSHAFTCASGATVGARLTVTVLNSVTPCAAGTWSVFSPAEMTQFTNTVATVATLQAAGGTGITPAQFAALETQVSNLQTNQLGLQSALSASSVMPTSADLTYAFGWGFGAIVLFGALGMAIGVGKTTVEKV